MIVHCNSCERDISSEAKTCPHCGQPDPYTEHDRRMDIAIHEHAKSAVDRDAAVTIGAMVIGIVWGWLKGGGLGAFLGFIAGTIVGQLVNKVRGWLS